MESLLLCSLAPTRPLLLPTLLLLLLLSRSVVPDSFATPWTAARQNPLSVGFPRPEYWSEYHSLSPGELPDPGVKRWSPALGALPVAQRYRLQCRSHWRHGFHLWVPKIPWRRAWKATQYSRLENLIDRGLWQASVHWVAKRRTQLKRHGTHARRLLRHRQILYHEATREALGLAESIQIAPSEKLRLQMPTISALWKMLQRDPRHS